MKSTGNPSSCDQKLLTDYEQKRPRYEELVKLTRNECDDLLESIPVKGVVQGRTKKFKS